MGENQDGSLNHNSSFSLPSTKLMAVHLPGAGWFHHGPLVPHDPAQPACGGGSWLSRLARSASWPCRNHGAGVRGLGVSLLFGCRWFRLGALVPRAPAQPASGGALAARLNQLREGRQPGSDFGGRPGRRMGAASPGRRPARFRASRSRYSICAFTDRRSSAAQRARAVCTDGSSRSSTCLRSGRSADLGVTDTAIPR